MLSIFGRPLMITSGGYEKAAGKNVGVTSKALYQVNLNSFAYPFLKYAAICIKVNSSELC